MSKPYVSPALRAKYAVPKMPQGTRLPDFVHETGHESFRLDKMPVGSYVKCVAVGGAVSWWAKDPAGHVLVWEGKLVTEEPDGTISVRGIIENRTPGVPKPWTGTMKMGKWTAA